jgi:hypothetical protein
MSAATLIGPCPVDALKSPCSYKTSSVYWFALLWSPISALQMLIQLWRASLKQRSLARLSATIFEKNHEGTWTSGPIAKIGSNPFSNLTLNE